MTDPGPRAAHLARGAAAPFEGDLVPRGDLTFLLERYVRARGERDRLRAELEGERARTPGLVGLARERGAADERARGAAVLLALEERAAWYRRPLLASAATALVLLAVTAVVLVPVGPVLVAAGYLAGRR